jgi:hypothetical protein
MKMPKKHPWVEWHKLQKELFDLGAKLDSGLKPAEERRLNELTLGQEYQYTKIFGYTLQSIVAAEDHLEKCKRCKEAVRATDVFNGSVGSDESAAVKEVLDRADRELDQFANAVLAHLSKEVVARLALGLPELRLEALNGIDEEQAKELLRASGAERVKARLRLAAGESSMTFSRLIHFSDPGGPLGYIDLPSLTVRVPESENRSARSGVPAEYCASKIAEAICVSQEIGLAVWRAIVETIRDRGGEEIGIVNEGLEGNELKIRRKNDLL